MQFLFIIFIFISLLFTSIFYLSKSSFSFSFSLFFISLTFFIAQSMNLTIVTIYISHKFKRKFNNLINIILEVSNSIFYFIFFRAQYIFIAIFILLIRHSFRLVYFFTFTYYNSFPDTNAN